MARTGLNPFDSRFSDVVFKQTVGNSAGDASISGTSKLTLYAIKITTADAGPNFFKMYDAKVPSASLAPDIVIPVVGSGTRAVTTIVISDGITFSTAISARITENVTVADTTSPSHSVGYSAVIS